MIESPHKQKNSHLLETARALFWRYGLKKVSVQEICLASGISKMTFYRSFKNKTELAKAVFDRITDENLEKFRNAINEKSAPREKITKLIAMKRQSAEGIGIEFLKDFYASDEEGLKSYIEERTKAAWDEMSDEFKRGQEQGFFRKDLNPQFLLYFSQVAGEMLSDERLIKLFDRPQDLLAEFSNFFAYGISPRS